jgi:ubiquinone/menaquinone biosynthesis C-methylase UbiE
MTEPTKWERAYQRFETPAEERRKFIRRLRSLGVERWSRDARILEVCSGRGNGMVAWRELGFSRVCGVDLSPALVEVSALKELCVVGDACRMPVRSASRDVVIIQGGLHHFPTFDLVRAGLAEMRRVLRPDGHVIIIEPYRTPFLTAVHFVSELGPMRALSNRLDAFATMTEEEYPLYHNWLAQPEKVLAAITQEFEPVWVRKRWGKLMFIGRPR